MGALLWEQYVEMWLGKLLLCRMVVAVQALYVAQGPNHKLAGANHKYT